MYPKSHQYSSTLSKSYLTACNNPKPFLFVTLQLSDMEAAMHSGYMLNYVIKLCHLGSSSWALQWVPLQPGEFVLFGLAIFSSTSSAGSLNVSQIPCPYTELWHSTSQSLSSLTEVAKHPLCSFFCSHLASCESSCCTMANFWLASRVSVLHVFEEYLLLFGFAFCQWFM